MRKAIPVLAALGLIAVVVLGAVGVTFIQRYTPSKEAADLSEIWNVEGNEIALLYNYELQETKGLYENGESYLPISWVNEHINKRFYWDEGEQLLVYALPDQIVYADLSTMGSSGASLLLLKENEVYLTLGLVSNYTNVQISAFDSAEVKRIFVTDWGARETAKVKRDGAVRELGGIKSPILTNVAKGQTVTVLETMEKWSRVATEDGCIGYIENRRLEEPSVIEFTGNFTEPVYESTRLEEKIVLGWHQVTSPEANGQLEQVVSAAEGLNVIAPTWFSLTDNEGNYRSLADREYVEKAHEMGLQVWALLDNFSNQVQTEVLLSSTSTRRKLINSLIADAAAYDLDGLNMDFEGIKEEAGVHYIQFLRELSIACREEGLILSVDNYVPTASNQFYDRKEQGIVADYVIVMGYDEHYAGGEPGSVASLEFVRSGIENTLKDVPKEKLINGVPFYTRLWTETLEGVESKALGISAAKKWIEENDVELYWQEPLGQYYGEHQTEDGIQYLWMEEEDSLREKMDLIREHDLAGVACWKLGLEDAAAWDSIRWQ